MAEGTRGLVEEVITFDIFEDQDSENIQFFTEDLSKDQQEEISDVVTLLDTVKSKELMAFTSQETSTHVCQQK